ncbi:DUF424 family protein [Candidatus Pacearchaeota archaeon]|nr:DUF424 family protein [Candidatus Pacearchaeota archaeon]
MICVKVISTYRDIVAVCDSNLLGKVFEDGDFQLEVKESFYKGDEASEKQVVDFLQDMAKDDATFNIVGKESVNAALKAGIIDNDSVGEVSGVPFALVLA